jgi:D-sedoheptulose 7-phosphate isomerase
MGLKHASQREHGPAGVAMNLQRYYQAEFAEHAAVVERTRLALTEPFAELVGQCLRCLQHGGKILFFGNGGSAADAQHLATELTVRFKGNRKAIAAIALTTDTSALTAIGNDLGFEQLFARQIEALGRPGDLALAITTSGESPNILQALRTARRCELVAAALAGKGGGHLNGLADPLLIVPSDVTARIQEMHILVGQMLCEAIEVGLGHAEVPLHAR